MRTTAPPLWLGVVVAASAILVETLLIVLLKSLSPMETFGVVYFLGALVVAIGWGWGLAAITAVISAIAFGYTRDWPYDTFHPADLRTWVVIGVFLAVTLLANTLADLARSRAAEAEERRREADLVAEQQAALRHVATSVARGVEPSDVFATVATELARALHADNAALYRYESDGTAVLLASRTGPGVQRMPVGEHFSLEGDTVAALVLRDGGAARMNSYDRAAGPAAARIRASGRRSGVGAPIIVDNTVWGVAIVSSAQAEPFPPDTEARLSDFADLVAVAIANAQARSDLTASRARIVTAADDARRRFERDLHDGAQQRVVSLALKLRMTEESLPSDLNTVKEQLAGIVSGLSDVSDELRAISRGIHPAILSKGGLGPALRALACRSAVPVDLVADIPGRLPDHAEVAAYYVVAEALTNATRHAGASEVKVTASVPEGRLELTIVDDGTGGADPSKGSGLIGLVDRVDAVGGSLRISSPAGVGTTLVVTIPCAREQRTA